MKTEEEALAHLNNITRQLCGHIGAYCLVDEPSVIGKAEDGRRSWQRTIYTGVTTVGATYKVRVDPDGKTWRTLLMVYVFPVHAVDDDPKIYWGNRYVNPGRDDLLAAHINTANKTLEYAQRTEEAPDEDEGELTEEELRELF